MFFQDGFNQSLDFVPEGGNFLLGLFLPNVKSLALVMVIVWRLHWKVLEHFAQGFIGFQKPNLETQPKQVSQISDPLALHLVPPIPFAFGVAVGIRLAARRSFSFLGCIKFRKEACCSVKFRASQSHQVSVAPQELLADVAMPLKKVRKELSARACSHAYDDAAD
jgi:hypothetical protein